MGRETLEILVRERHGPRNHMNPCTKTPWATKPLWIPADFRIHRRAGARKKKPNSERLLGMEATRALAIAGGSLKAFFCFCFACLHYNVAGSGILRNRTAKNQRLPHRSNISVISDWHIYTYTTTTSLEYVILFCIILLVFYYFEIIVCCCLRFVVAFQSIPEVYLIF